MNTSKYPLIWGHRGASGHAPENTLPAFKMAADMGADGVELDIQMTRDGEIVVCHDETIDRTSSGKGWLKDFTFDELRRLDFSNGNSAYEGVKIPTMEEVFDLLEELTKRKHLEDRVIYSSFNHYTVRRIKELNPEAKTGLLYGDGPIDMPGYGHRLGADALHPACTPLSTISSILISWRTAASMALMSMSGPSTPQPSFGPAGSTA